MVQTFEEDNMEEEGLGDLEDEGIDGFTAEELAELENMDSDELAALEAELAEEEAQQAQQESLGKRPQPVS